MITNQHVHSDLPIPPGEYLNEVLDDLGMNQADLARRMGRPLQAINEIIKGNKSITPDTALQLEKVIPEVPAYLWTKLEEEYQLALARQNEVKQLEKEVELLDAKLYKAMAKLRWVEPVKNDLEKVNELLRFFGVSSLANLADVRSYSPAFRISTSHGKNACNYALASWLRKGELEARELDRRVTIQPYSTDKLKNTLTKLCNLTLKTPDEFVPEAQNLLAQCGVILVILPHLPKTYAHGVTFWLSPTKAVVQLSIRGSWADIFWFSLFHELGHILLHGKRDKIVTFDPKHLPDDPILIQLEDEANKFAANTLIPPSKYRAFIDMEDFSSTCVEAFAQQLKIAPGIIVGRLHHDDHVLQNQLNSLRERYRWEQ